MADRLETDLIVEAISKGFQNVHRDLDKLDKSGRQAGQGMEELNKAGEKQRGTLDKLKDNWQNIAVGIGAAYGAIQTIKRGWEFASEGAQIEKVRNTFDSLTASIGTTSQALLMDLREATAGMVADTELMASANRFLSMGLAETSDQASELSRVAVTLGSAMGKNATASMEEFALLLANQSIPRLDTFGISAGKVRARINELQKANKGMSRETAFMTATMEEAAISMEKLGGEVPVDEFTKFETNIANVTDNLKILAAKGLGPVVGEANEAASGFAEVSQEYERAKVLLDRGQITWLEFLKVLTLVGYSGYQDASAFRELLDPMDAANERAAAMNEYFSRLYGIEQDVEQATIEMTDAMKEYWEQQQQNVIIQETALRNEELLEKQYLKSKQAQNELTGAVGDGISILSDYEQAQLSLAEKIEGSREAIDNAKRDILGLGEAMDFARGRATYEIFVEATQAKAEQQTLLDQLDEIAGFWEADVQARVNPEGKKDVATLAGDLDNIAAFWEAQVKTEAQQAQEDAELLHTELDQISTAEGLDAWAVKFDTSDANRAKEDEVFPLHDAAKTFVDDAPYEALFDANTDVAYADVESLRDLANRTAGDYNIHFSITTSGSPPSGPGYQGGGYIPAGQPAIVGERGQELIYSNQGMHVIPNSQVNLGGVTANFFGPMGRTDGQQVADELAGLVAVRLGNRMRG